MTSLPPDPRLHAVAPDVYAWIGAAGDSNAGAIDTGDGLIVIDSQQTEPLARLFRETLEGETGKPVKMLVNTHYHIDHVAGNAAFDGVPIVAQERTQTVYAALLGPRRGNGWTVDDLRTKTALLFGENFSDLVAEDDPQCGWFRERLAGPDYASIRIVPPTQTFSDKLAFHLPNDVVRLSYLGPAHCDGDVVVHVERERVVFLGDLFFHDRFPWLGDCDLEGWIRVLDCVMAAEVDVVIPGHGPPATLRELGAFRDLLIALRDAVETAQRRGASEEAAAREVRLPRYAAMPRYAEWIAFDVRAAYRYLRGERHRRRMPA